MTRIMIYLLDTDNMSLIERGGPEALRLKARVAMIPPDDIATTVVSYEEQMRGWLAVSAKARTPDALIAAYRRLKSHLAVYTKIAVVDFEEKAAAEYERLKQLKIRIGTQDLKIAAITLANNAILLTRNTRDFARIPGLQYADWTP